MSLMAKIRLTNNRYSFAIDPSPCFGSFPWAMSLRNSVILFPNCVYFLFAPVDLNTASATSSVNDLQAYLMRVARLSSETLSLNLRRILFGSDARFSAASQIAFLANSELRCVLPYALRLPEITLEILAQMQTLAILLLNR